MLYFQYGSHKAGGLEHVPKGWQWWAGLKGNSRYYNYTLSINGTAKHFSSSYLTDHIVRYLIILTSVAFFSLSKIYFFTFLQHELSLEFLRSQSAEANPFLMILAPPAPHAPYTPSPKYAKAFPNVSVPRTPNFNPSEQKVIKT